MKNYIFKKYIYFFYTLKTEKLQVTGYIFKNKKIMREITENKIQQEIVLWFNNNYCLKHNNPRCVIFSVPNDSINAIETKRKVNTGLLRGVSDLIVVLPNKILFVEIKTQKGIQSEYQKCFQLRVELLGFEYCLVRSLEEFKKIIHLIV